MATWQSVFIGGFLIFNLFLFWKSYQECQRGRSFWLTRPLFLLGMFVWGDAVVLSLFWSAVAVASLLFQDWRVFLVLVSVFWLVRSIGETIYWFLQQFATTKRDPAKNLAGYHLVKNEAIWFMYQLFWQCMTVVSLISTVYLLNLWLSGD